MVRTLQILQEEVKSCTKCELHATRRQTVFSRGNPEASLCLVGEAPGEDEDNAGVPFVGRSGKLLDETLTSLGLDVEKEIYICNIIKCRPPNNRRPTEEEIESCYPYLGDQLEIVNPKVIVVLGNTAASSWLGLTQGITKIRGRFFNGHLRGKKIISMPAYHPSYVLRNGGKSPVFDDFKNDLQSAINKSRETNALLQRP